MGIDYGRKKIGLAIAEGPLAEPYAVIRYENEEVLSKKIRKIIKKEGVERIIVGISEGEMARETRLFGESLERELDIPLEFFDETLTSMDATRLSVEAGIKRRKRKEFEDAYAAAIMLQSHLDRKDL